MVAAAHMLRATATPSVDAAAAAVLVAIGAICRPVRQRWDSRWQDGCTGGAGNIVVAVYEVPGEVEIFLDGHHTVEAHAGSS